MVSLKTVQLKVYKAVVLLTLLYACKTWTVYQRHAKRLNLFHTSCLRKLLKIKWPERIPDTEVLKRAAMQSVHTLLNWHTCYQDAWGTFAKENTLWRTRNGQTLHWWSEEAKQRHPQTFLKDFNIPTESWEQIAQDRAKWRGLIRRGGSEYEAKRISEAEQKRAQRKARAKASPTELSCSDLCFSICNRSLELELVQSAILEHTNSSTSRMWVRLFIVSNDRRTI